MVKLIEGNVLLKPSHRRQLMTWLKRVQKLGEQVGNFILTIKLHRIGRVTEVTADVHDAIGDFSFRVRRPEWRDALREMAQLVAGRLHDERVGMTLA
jgi:hypothetical protein